MKRNKGKQVKKNMRFSQRKTMAQKWLMQLENNEDIDIIKCYRKKFAVDRFKAVKELQSLGVVLTREQIEKEKKAVERHRQNQIRKKQQKQKEKEMTSLMLDQDENFYYIAGYTSGGAAYGVTWQEMGLEPFEDRDELF